MAKKKKTKNHITYKKKFIVDADGHKHAPFVVTAVFSEEYDDDGEFNAHSVGPKLIELAARNSGVVEDNNSGQIEFGFFTKKGLKIFCEKALFRYEYKNDLDLVIKRAVVEYEDVHIL